MISPEDDADKHCTCNTARLSFHMPVDVLQRTPRQLAAQLVQYAGFFVQQCLGVVEPTTQAATQEDAVCFTSRKDFASSGPLPALVRMALPVKQKESAAG